MSNETRAQRWTPRLIPRTSYLIGAMVRSGSTLLCELLQSSGLAGAPDEFFLPIRETEFAGKWGVTGFPSYLDAALEAGMSENGVFGAKIIGQSHLEYLADRLRRLYLLPNSTTPDILNTAFPNLHYIWITRRDKLRQAVSFSRAEQSDVWKSTKTPVKPALELRFDFEQIDRAMFRITQVDAAWHRYFETHGITPFRVVYEELVEAPEETANQILQFLGIPIPDGFLFGERRLRKQADALSEEWVRCYQELKRQGTGGWTPAPMSLT